MLVFIERHLVFKTPRDQKRVSNVPAEPIVPVSVCDAVVRDTSPLFKGSHDESEDDEDNED